jgi:anti-sigma factor ChrR (cupin superfamily)
MALLLGVCKAPTARMMVLLFWTTYIPCSGHPTLLHSIPPQVTAGKTLEMFLIVPMSWRMYGRKWLLMYM